MAVALVTGPTAGIGHAFATALAREGNDLVLVSRDAERLKSVATDLSTRFGVRTTYRPADLRSLDDLRGIEAEIAASPVDILVNNAGFAIGSSFVDNDVEAEHAYLGVLVTAVLRLTHAALGPMVERGAGEIVNVSSVAGFLARGTYGAHKAWVTRFSRSMRAQYGTDDLRIMALCPGFVRTEFHERVGADVSRIPGPMWLDADDVVGEALADLRRGRAVSIPSRRWRAIVRASYLLPDGLVARFNRVGRPTT